MSQKSGPAKLSSERIVRDIRRRRASNIRPRRKSASCWMGFAASTASRSCADVRASPRAYITPGRREFLEAGKRRLAGDIARAATSGEVKDLRRQAQALELRLLKKSMIADG